MNEFPAEFFLSVLSTVNLVVASNVLVEGAQEDHGHHTREEEDDDQGVENGEPLDVGMGHTLKDVVPTGTPFDAGVLFKADPVGVSDGEAAFVVRFGRDGHGLFVGEGGGAVAASVGAMVDGARSQLDGDDPAPNIVFREEFAPILIFSRMVGNDDVHVVEDVKGVLFIVLSGDDAGVLRVALLVHVTAHGESGGAVLLSILHGVAPGHRHVVHDPVVLIVHAHPLLQLVQLFLCVGIAEIVRLCADRLAFAAILLECDLPGKMKQDINSMNQKALALPFHLDRVFFK